MQSPVNGTVYMACIHLLRSFVHRIGMETTDRQMAPTKFQKTALPTKNSTNYPVLVLFAIAVCILLIVDL
jgi:hypothetical protein